MIVKKRGGITPSWSPRATRAKSVRAGVLCGSERCMKENGKDRILGEETL